jgi:hypothetical protein
MGFPTTMLCWALFLEVKPLKEYLVGVLVAQADGDLNTG